MCVNFQPVTRQQLTNYFHSPIQDEAEWKTDIWQDYVAPIIVGGKNGRHSLLANYSMIPKKFIPDGVKRYTTMNARAETIGQLRSYAAPWRQCQFCLVPMMAFYEPNYESGKAERWKIGMVDGSPFAVLGLYRLWTEPDNTSSYSFTQITINADKHPLMKRFHKAGDEKRSLVILPSDAYDDWLSCHEPDQARSFLIHFAAEKMSGIAAPKEDKTIECRRHPEQLSN